MFDILAHPDLVKVWGAGAPVPEGDLRRFYELAMDGIAESDVAIEVSTAGLRKPVGEIYPAAAFLEMCLEAGRPVALSSDAHVPEHLGYGYERALEWLRRDRRRGDRGVRGAQRRLEPSGERAHRHRLGLPPLRGGRPAGARRRGDPGAEHGLAGHSDADVLTHAIIDALLGAAGLGDIGQHFPDTDERWRTPTRIELLARCARSSRTTAGLRPSTWTPP